MAFVPRLDQNTPTPMANNDWWYSSENIFYRYGYGLPNCTCYAYGRYAEIRGAFAQLPQWDAKDWWDSATDFERGQEPKLGAVICFGDNRPDGSGHVAIVEEIDENGDIKTSNSAYGGTYFYTETLTQANNYVPEDRIGTFYLQGFIYNDAIGTFSCSDFVIAAMCGNFNEESWVNPGVWENTTVPPEPMWEQLNVGYGLGQWTNTNGDTHGRLYQLHSWMTSNGYNIDDGDGQLDYLVYENYWLNNEAGYDDLLDYLQSTDTDIPRLVEQFKLNWEGNYNNTLQRRIDAATDFYNAILERKNDDPALYAWISSNDILTPSEKINNVMCIYFYFKGYNPSPPTPPTPPLDYISRKMPIWMMYGYIFRR